MKSLGKDLIFGREIEYFIGELSNDRWAEYRSIEGQIIIDPRAQNIVQVTLHEQFHAVWDRLSLNQTSISSDIQEIICDAFATWVVEKYKLKPK